MCVYFSVLICSVCVCASKPGWHAEAVGPPPAAPQMTGISLDTKAPNTNERGQSTPTHTFSHILAFGLRFRQRSGTSLSQEACACNVSDLEIKVWLLWRSLSVSA